MPGLIGSIFIRLEWHAWIRSATAKRCVIGHSEVPAVTNVIFGKQFVLKYKILDNLIGEIPGPRAPAGCILPMGEVFHTYQTAVCLKLGLRKFLV